MTQTIKKLKKLYSVNPLHLIPVAVVGWAISIDGPTANAIAVGLIAGYFEFRRQKDAKATKNVAMLEAIEAAVKAALDEEKKANAKPATTPTAA